MTATDDNQTRSDQEPTPIFDEVAEKLGNPLPDDSNPADPNGK